MKNNNKEIERGVKIINSVVDKITLPYSIMPDNRIMLSFSKIFAHKEDDLVSHYMDKFICNKDKDWGSYMLNAECAINTRVF